VELNFYSLIHLHGVVTAEVLTAVKISTVVFWVVKPCRLTCVYNL